MLASSRVGISDREFDALRKFIHDAAGIRLSAEKRDLVRGRLGRRLDHHRLASYSDYLALLGGRDGAAEAQIAIDLLTTNETYFFREPKHFDFLRALVADRRAGAPPFRVWSAASSSGEEAYSIAMVLADGLGGAPWEVVGTDISSRMVERARTGHYPQERAQLIPEPCLKRYCLRGVGRQEGTLLVDRALRARVRFVQANLNGPLPDLGVFDVAFLRNVLIYFDADTKRRVVERVAGQLAPGGHLLVGHSESLNDLTRAVLQVAPAIYRKP